MTDKQQSPEKDEALLKKYNKLKRRYRQLRAEYTTTLDSWEQGARSIKNLLDERRFLLQLVTLFQSQSFLDEEVSAEKRPTPADIDLTGGKEAASNQSTV